MYYIASCANLPDGPEGGGCGGVVDTVPIITNAGCVLSTPFHHLKMIVSKSSQDIKTLTQLDYCARAIKIRP